MVQPMVYGIKARDGWTYFLITDIKTVWKFWQTAKASILVGDNVVNATFIDDYGKIHREILGDS